MPVGACRTWRGACRQPSTRPTWQRPRPRLHLMHWPRSGRGTALQAGPVHLLGCQAGLHRARHETCCIAACGRGYVLAVRLAWLCQSGRWRRHPLCFAEGGSGVPSARAVARDLTTSMHPAQSLMTVSPPCARCLRRMLASTLLAHMQPLDCPDVLGNRPNPRHLHTRLDPVNGKSLLQAPARIVQVPQGAGPRDACLQVLQPQGWGAVRGGRPCQHRAFAAGGRSRRWVSHATEIAGLESCARQQGVRHPCRACWAPEASPTRT